MRRKAPSAGHELEPLARLRVLMVEDDADDAELMAHELRRSGLEIEWTRVETEEGFLQQLGRKPDVILVDNSLPQFGAAAALRRLKERDAELPLIVVSGTLADEAAVELVRRGASDYILKDRLARLGEAVAVALERRRLREELREQASRLRLLSNQAPGIVWITDQWLRCTYAGGRDAFELGARQDELIGRLMPELLGRPDRASEAWLAHARALEGGSETFELRLAARVFQCSVEPLRQEGAAVAGVVGTAIDITERSRAEAALLEREQRIRRLFSGLVRAQETERARIAADVHDDPLQNMAAVQMQLEVLNRSLRSRRDREAVQELQEAVAASVVNLRDLLFELRPRALDEEGLAAAFREHIARLPSDVETHLESRLVAEPPEEVRASLYRIGQEALVNARKHAGAARIDVVLEDREGGIRLEIRDDGRGFEPGAARPREGHLGLPSMIERAEMAGGWCRVSSKPGAGTTVEVWVPVA